MPFVLERVPIGTRPTDQVLERIAKGASVTWLDPEVSAARRKRARPLVTVDGTTTEHRSTRAAFAYFGLPDGQHQSFRAMLKESGREFFDGPDKTYLFEMVE